MVCGVVNLQEKPYYVLEGEGKSWFYMSKGLQARTLVQLYTVTGVPLLTASEHSYCQHGTLIWALRLLVPFQRDYNSMSHVDGPLMSQS